MRLLSDKIAIVTGAGRGIGKAISLMLARSGAAVVLASRSTAQLEATRDEIQREGAQALVVPTDLTRSEEIETLVRRTLEQYGSIDYLINNAGWGKHSPVVKARMEDWDRTFQVNLRAPMLLSKLVLPGMIEKRSGAIVNIASISGKAVEANTAAYSASKAGLLAFGEALYEEVREYGIKVAAILPGFVDTPLIPATVKLDRGKMIRPEDVAQTVLFILTSAPNSCPVKITVRPQRSPYKTGDRH
ncbi:MAG: SDR family oxidoreductase [Deltaproteobacteria bacterium]|nr:SDR family oxidoreductase [Deltaproteobacteria bacterium]